MSTLTTDDISLLNGYETDQPSVQTTSILTSGEEILYDLLFSDEKPKTTNDSSDYNSAEFKRSSLDESFSYLQELNSFHIDRLQAEPSMLLDSQQHIQEEIKNLAFSNYKTFIRTAQCSREIYSDFSVIESKLDQLINTLPEFGFLCENFTRNIQTINASRRTNNLTLQKHNQLLEILEISQLMDTCVRNEYYEEALDLAGYVKRLEKKFASSIPLIQQIVNDVNKSLNFMLKQLLQQLKTNLQFNQCLKIIGIIRRLDVFSESELRIKFLQLRDSWLQSLLQNIPQNDPYHHISKTIEENRIHLFDIITQYRAIFSDEDLLVSNMQQQVITNILLSTNKDASESKLFFCWLQQKIKNFLNILRKDLKLGVGNRLDSVLSQAMYFGLAFSRVGLDFRVLMVPIFEEAVLDQMRASFRNANAKFEESLGKLNWSELYVETGKSMINMQSTSEDKNKSLFVPTSSSTSIINPPVQLLDYQPLALYLNCILQSFNEFRLCAPLNLFFKISDEMRTSIKSIGNLLDGYYKKEKASFDKNEHELFLNFLFNLAYCLIPFLEKCLSVLFPIEQFQKVTAIPQNELEKLKKFYKLDAKELLLAIFDFIPAPKSVIEPVQVQNVVSSDDIINTNDHKLNVNEEKVLDDNNKENNDLISKEIENNETVNENLNVELDKNDDNNQESDSKLD